MIAALTKRGKRIVPRIIKDIQRFARFSANVNDTEWFTAGLEKLTGRSFSIGSFGQTVQGGPWVLSGHDGAAIKGFVAGALAQSGGPHLAVQGWYAWFLQQMVLPNTAVFAYTITFGEVLVGLGPHLWRSHHFI